MITIVWSRMRSKWVLQEVYSDGSIGPLILSQPGPYQTEFDTHAEAVKWVEENL